MPERRAVTGSVPFLVTYVEVDFFGENSRCSDSKISWMKGGREWRETLWPFGVEPIVKVGSQNGGVLEGYYGLMFIIPMKAAAAKTAWYTEGRKSQRRWKARG